MKAVIREIFVHVLFVLLCQLVCNAAVDDNFYLLHENARTFMIHNAVTMSYFEVKSTLPGLIVGSITIIFGLKFGFLRLNQSFIHPLYTHSLFQNCPIFDPPPFLICFYIESGFDKSLFQKSCKNRNIFYIFIEFRFSQLV